MVKRTGSEQSGLNTALVNSGRVRLCPVQDIQLQTAANMGLAGVALLPPLGSS